MALREDGSTDHCSAVFLYVTYFSLHRNYSLPFPEAGLLHATKIGGHGYRFQGIESSVLL